MITKILKKLWEATVISIQGIRVALHKQFAFQLEVFAFICATPCALYLGKTPGEKALLIFAVVLILIVELVNSAIETIVNRIGLERNVLSGQAKDLGSAAVFVAVINACAIWVIILFS